MSRIAGSRVAYLARAFVIVFVVAILGAGCASLPPLQTANELHQIAGKWEGRLGDGRPATMTISQDGRYQGVIAGSSGFAGQVQVSEGRFRFKSETTGQSGTMTLYEGDGKRILRTSTDNGSITSEYSPAKP
jgi:hypothetical protein